MEGEEERLLKVDVKNIWFEYDDKNDILYINFGEKKESAEESFLTEDNIVVGVKGDRLISLTVFDFMKRVRGTS